MVITGLDHITTPLCTICGCKDITKIIKEQQHTNGHWNETLKFACGRKWYFSPNSMETTELSPCKRNSEYQKMIIQRKATYKNLIRYVKKLKTDKVYKDRILYDIERSMLYHVDFN